ncbi:MAG TPA: protoporphyrinogen oxidase [Terriglobales bacterium]|nr:protoporphyrinogen oxidase [Terriglobales bacterium]
MGMKRIAIVGGGISGLAAATIVERARREGAAVEFTLFERGSRLGGVMITDHVDGCLVEAGPDSFLTEKSWGLDFCRSLGLGDQIIGSNDNERKTYILVNGRLVSIPDGLMFMVPTKLLPTITSPLFSWSTKIRMGLEYFHAPKLCTNGDESVAQLVERHYGREMVQRLADPLLAGVYGGDAESLSAAAVLPRFVDMEKRYGSLSRGMLAARKKMAAMMREKHGANHQSAPRPLFSSLKAGMQQLVDAVADFLPRESMQLNREVTAILYDGTQWRLVTAAGVEVFEGLIIATPAQLAGRLISGVAPPLANELLDVSYSSSVTVTGVYDRADLRNLPPGFGFLVPRNEGKRMLACTFVHNKFPHRAPEDRGIIRTFLGGLRDASVLAQSDEEILAIVRRELKEIVGLEAEPRAERVYRWNRSMAQYGPGHMARVRHIQSASNQLHSFALAGNAYEGIGVPDCIASGTVAAADVVEQLGLPRPQVAAKGEEKAFTRPTGVSR